MLIIEGCDNTGKTTLAKKLSEYLGWEVIHSPGPLDQGPKMMTWLVNEIESNPKPAIYDRISLISDKVYAPIVRGESTYYVKNPLLEKIMKDLICGRPHLLIFCRPSKDKILNNQGRDQMDGVLENHKKLSDSYDDIINEYGVDNRFNVVVYDYDNPESIEVTYEKLNQYREELNKMNTSLLPVFQKQLELMEKYEVIESHNGFYVPHQIPLDINNKFNQLKLKEFAWRITEELAEAVAEFGAPARNKELREELADVLHFNSEMTILLGLETEVEKQFQAVIRNLDDYVNRSEAWNYLELYGKVTYELAMVCHMLKNKPWKQSHKETDPNELMFKFLSFWDSYFLMVVKSGMNMEALVGEYLKKHQVNKQRQENGY